MLSVDDKVPTLAEDKFSLTLSDERVIFVGATLVVVFPEPDPDPEPEPEPTGVGAELPPPPPPPHAATIKAIRLAEASLGPLRNFMRSSYFSYTRHTV